YHLDLHSFPTRRSSDLGWRYRVLPGATREPSWAIERATDEGWQTMHLFDELPVRPVDVAMGHHWTSTHPDSHFTTGLSFGCLLRSEEHTSELQSRFDLV